MFKSLATKITCGFSKAFEGFVSNDKKGINAAKEKISAIPLIIIKKINKKICCFFFKSIYLYNLLKSIIVFKEELLIKFLKVTS